MVRYPAEVRRWLRVSGKESPIHARLVWPERLSKGRTRTTRPLVSAVAESAADCEVAGRVAKSSKRAGHRFCNGGRTLEDHVTDISIERQCLPGCASAAST